MHAHCHGLDKCRFEPRYSSLSPSAEVISALASCEYDSDDGFVEAIRAAADKNYVGEACQTCGTVVPMDAP